MDLHCYKDGSHYTRVSAHSESLVQSEVLFLFKTVSQNGSIISVSCYLFMVISQPGVMHSGKYITDMEYKRDPTGIQKPIETF